ncbi:hypothetical protein DAEQUDRAFT_100190 [Daedalea quercina L-15889]|uniref:Uncharacterized protein n=1 Tax=Daedalea quercina L-15889 TaxID=1314783 RepID=A0A165KX39_9APHY|nr:hypothetical protein DAEQUDRAFT_100190 [Daedalea quercina L-15889]
MRGVPYTSMFLSRRTSNATDRSVYRELDARHHPDETGSGASIATRRRTHRYTNDYCRIHWVFWGGRLAGSQRSDESIAPGESVFQ